MNAAFGLRFAAGFFAAAFRAGFFAGAFLAVAFFAAPFFAAGFFAGFLAGFLAAFLAVAIVLLPVGWCATTTPNVLKQTLLSRVLPASSPLTIPHSQRKGTPASCFFHRENRFVAPLRQRGVSLVSASASAPACGAKPAPGTTRPAEAGRFRPGFGDATLPLTAPHCPSRTPAMPRFRLPP